MKSHSVVIDLMDSERPAEGTSQQRWAMPVLILATASVLFFFFVVALLCIANTLELRTLRRKRILTQAKPLALLSITEAFDPIYSVLWEAPIAALELINSAGTSGMPVARLRPLYDEAAARFPEIYDDCSFLQWLRVSNKTASTGINNGTSLERWRRTTHRCRGFSRSGSTEPAPRLPARTTEEAR